MRRQLRSVRIVSSAMQSNRMPNGPTWAARNRVQHSLPAFAPPQAAVPRKAVTAIQELG